MIFYEDEVVQYVNLVRDENPLHPDVVPGQMVVERIWKTLKITPSHFQVKYKKVIRLEEDYTIEHKGKRIAIKSQTGETMMVVLLKK